MEITKEYLQSLLSSGIEPLQTSRSYVCIEGTASSDARIFYCFDSGLPTPANKDRHEGPHTSFSQFVHQCKTQLEQEGFIVKEYTITHPDRDPSYAIIHTA